MSDPRQLEYLDALLKGTGCRLQGMGRETIVEFGVGTKRDQVLAGLLRIVLGHPVHLRDAASIEHRPGTCKYCGQAIVFIKSAKTDKWIPADQRPLLGVADDGTAARFREAHFSTCPMRDRIASERARAQHKAEVDKSTATE